MLIMIHFRLLIVARAILRDPWDQWEIDHPLDVIEPSFLYKLIMVGVSNGTLHHSAFVFLFSRIIYCFDFDSDQKLFYHFSGEEVEEYFPIEDLAELEILNHLFATPSAKYLLSACYEHLCLQAPGNMS
jgi:hypothetical protein